MATAAAAAAVAAMVPTMTMAAAAAVTRATTTTAAVAAVMMMNDGARGSLSRGCRHKGAFRSQSRPSRSLPPSTSAQATCSVSPAGKPCHGGAEGATPCTGVVTFSQARGDPRPYSYADG